jgi:hypothetical protein
MCHHSKELLTSTITGFLPGQTHDRQAAGRSPLTTPNNFTIFEGISEIQRKIISRAPDLKHAILVPGSLVCVAILEPA